MRSIVLLSIATLISMPVWAQGRDVAETDFWQAAQTEWGQSVPPANVQVLNQDITCDGAADYVAAHIDRDNPDGPHFDLIVVTNHGGVLYKEAVSLPFTGASEQFGLCGTPGETPDPQVVIEEFWSGDALAERGILDVCGTPVAVVDGMCDSPRFFWTDVSKVGSSHLIFHRN